MRCYGFLIKKILVTHVEIMHEENSCHILFLVASGTSPRGLSHRVLFKRQHMVDDNKIYQNKFICSHINMPRNKRKVLCFTILIRVPFQLDITIKRDHIYLLNFNKYSQQEESRENIITLYIFFRELTSHYT
jgi:hypothetical protein